MGKRSYDDGRPKGKVTAYVFFVRHQHEVNKDIKLPFSEFSKQCSKIWKDMTLAEKEPFQAQADADKERYDEEPGLAIGIGFLSARYRFSIGIGYRSVSGQDFWKNTRFMPDFCANI